MTNSIDLSGKGAVVFGVANHRSIAWSIAEELHGAGAHLTVAYQNDYRHGSTLYRIEVENPSGVCRGVSSLSLDGAPLPVDGLVPLSDDGREHRVQVVLG